MLKKIIAISSLIFCFHQSGFSQEFMQSLGATISILSGNISSPGETSSFTMEQSNVTYFPRYNFIENANSSVSIGAPVGVGIGLAMNTDYSDARIAFAFDLPAVIDYNIGFKSTSESSNYFGGYFGAGFGYYHVSISGSSYSNFKGSTYGPLVRGGVRIGSAKESWNDHGFTVGVFYKKGLENLSLTHLDLMC